MTLQGAHSETKPEAQAKTLKRRFQAPNSYKKATLKVSGRTYPKIAEAPPECRLKISFGYHYFPPTTKVGFQTAKKKQKTVHQKCSPKRILILGNSLRIFEKAESTKKYQEKEKVPSITEKCQFGTKVPKFPCLEQGCQNSIFQKF